LLPPPPLRLLSAGTTELPRGSRTHGMIRTFPRRTSYSGSLQIVTSFRHFELTDGSLDFPAFFARKCLFHSYERAAVPIGSPSVRPVWAKTLSDSRFEFTDVSARRRFLDFVSEPSVTRARDGGASWHVTRNERINRSPRPGSKSETTLSIFPRFSLEIAI